MQSITNADFKTTASFTTFDFIKSHHHDTLYAAIKEKKADVLTIPLCKKIDRKKHYFTSSSCSGRIILLQLEKNEQKRPGGFLAKWHREVKFAEVKKALQQKQDGHYVWLKQEPLILHIGCETLTDVEKLFVILRQVGFKRFGLQTLQEGRYMVELVGTQNMHFLAKEKNKILCPDSFLKIQVKKANEKFKKNLILIKKMEKQVAQLE